MINSLALAYMGRQAVAEPKSILDEAAQATPQPAKPLPAAPPPAKPGTGTH
jgi:hypothetical protein